MEPAGASKFLEQAEKSYPMQDQLSVVFGIENEPKHSQDMIYL